MYKRSPDALCTWSLLASRSVGLEPVTACICAEKRAKEGKNTFFFFFIRSRAISLVLRLTRLVKLFLGM